MTGPKVKILKVGYYLDHNEKCIQKSTDMPSIGYSHL